MAGVKVRADAGGICRRELNRHRHPSAGYSHQEFLWLHLIDALEGEVWPLATDAIEGGVAECYYVVLPDGFKDASRRPRKGVVALPERLAESAVEEVVGVAAPRDLADTGNNRVWRAHGYEIVRLITPWTDEFMAFISK